MRVLWGYCLCCEYALKNGSLYTLSLYAQRCGTRPLGEAIGYTINNCINEFWTMMLSVWSDHYLLLDSEWILSFAICKATQFVFLNYRVRDHKNKCNIWTWDLRAYGSWEQQRMLLTEYVILKQNYSDISN